MKLTPGMVLTPFPSRVGWNTIRTHDRLSSSLSTSSDFRPKGPFSSGLLYHSYLEWHINEYNKNIANRDFYLSVPYRISYCIARKNRNTRRRSVDASDMIDCCLIEWLPTSSEPFEVKVFRTENCKRDDFIKTTIFFLNGHQEWQPT